MRDVFLIIVVLTLFPSCDRYLWDYPFNRPRSVVISSGGVPSRNADVPPEVAKTSDTSIYICGVRVPDGYDWQKDTALGIGRGELVLLKDMKEIVSFSTGYAECVGTDPDTHHLIDGHLYTEFSTDTRTIIKRDGGTVTSFEGREFLSGLVIRDGDVYSLGRRRSGYGFTYRKNGEVLLDRQSGMVFGSFLDPSYPHTGALYEDDGSICFAYMEENTSSVHLVVDGSDRILGRYGWNPAECDVKMYGGQPYAAGIAGYGGIEYIPPSGRTYVASGYVWENCCIVPSETGMFLAGNIAGYGRMRSAVYSIAAQSAGIYEFEDYDIRCRDGTVTLSPVSYQGYHCFSRMCLAHCGKDDYAVLSPEDGSNPVLRKNGEDVEIGINGYLTGVEICVSPPS